jgi:proteasome assembly chaperone (PAC2) family protein
VSDDPLRSFVKPRLTDPVMLLAFEGFNDAGEAATSALQFLNRSLRAVPLAEIDGEEFYDFTVRRPSVVLEQSRARRVVWPSNDFRYGSLSTRSGEREVVTLVGIEPHLRWRRFSERVLAYAEELGVRQVVLLGAYLADVVYSQPVKVTGFASNPDDLAKLGVEGSSYEGPTGIVGVLGERFQSRGMRVASFWAGLPHYINAAPNPRGALALLEVLQRSLGFELDLEPLDKLAGEFEERISRLVSDDPELAEYVRQLKKREFAG